MNNPTPNERTTRALINYLTTDGGCTLGTDDVPCTKGYAVGLGGAKALNPKRSYYAQIHSIVSRARREGSEVAFGAWHDAKTGLDYVEPVQIFDNELIATYIGRGRGELAIFDLTNGVEIRL